MRPEVKLTIIGDGTIVNVTTAKANKRITKAPDVYRETLWYNMDGKTSPRNGEIREQTTEF